MPHLFALTSKLPLCAIYTVCLMCSLCSMCTMSNHKKNMLVKLDSVSNSYSNRKAWTYSETGMPNNAWNKSNILWGQSADNPQTSQAIWKMLISYDTFRKRRSLKSDAHCKFFLKILKPKNGRKHVEESPLRHINSFILRPKRQKFGICNPLFCTLWRITVITFLKCCIMSW